MQLYFFSLVVVLLLSDLALLVEDCIHLPDEICDGLVQPCREVWLPVTPGWGGPVRGGGHSSVLLIFQISQTYYLLISQLQAKGIL